MASFNHQGLVVIFRPRRGTLNAVERSDVRLRIEGADKEDRQIVAFVKTRL